MQARFDENNRTTILGADDISFQTPITIGADPTTHEMLVKARINETAPTDSTKQNPALALSYDSDGQLINITMSVGLNSYSKDFTWVGGDLVNISSWT